jgi:protocatechuate 3,4-dioxygenase beta subunit
MNWALMVGLLTAAWVPAARSQADPGRAAGPRSAAEGSDSAARQGRTLEFRVVDARDKTPLSDVSIVVLAVGVTDPTRLATDGDGRCRIAIPQQVNEFLGISARKEGFVPVRVAWRGHDIGAVLPGSYTLALEPGTPIGGTVRDSRGRPIAGALVYVWFERGPPENEREQLYLEDDYYAKTDAQGRWQCTMMPGDLSAKDRLMFRLIHPDYASEPVDYRRELPIEQLRVMTGVMVMEDGLAMTGRVVNSRGLPVRGARAILKVQGYGINPDSLTPELAGILQTRTDADGRFRFGHVEPGEHQVDIEADGYLRRSTPVVVGTGSEPAEIRLTSITELEEAAHAARRDAEQILVEEERTGLNDIPQSWVMNGVLIVVAGVSLILILWRWTVVGRGRRALSDE